MGLDMYLYAEKYISSTGAFNENDPKQYNKTLEACGMDTLPKGQFASISVKSQVAYWRKANAIHGWFVRECANGVDECQDIYVSKDKLVELRNACVEALTHRHTATKPKESDYVVKLDSKDIIQSVQDTIITSVMEKQFVDTNTDYKADPLAPTAGFFFGSTDKDEHYYNDLTYTVEVINALLTQMVDNEFRYNIIYNASW